MNKIKIYSYIEKRTISSRLYSEPPVLKGQKGQQVLPIFNDFSLPNVHRIGERSDAQVLQEGIVEGRGSVSTKLDACKEIH